MGRQAKNTQAPDWVNFHFPSSPPSHSQLMDEEQRRRISRPRHQPKPKHAQYRRSDKDRSFARRTGSSMFHLHSSADHAFVITRCAKNGGYAFSGPDVAVPWEAVRTVKYFIPSTEAWSEATCPICLDALKCARITKCGHCFCLPCLLRHVHSQTELLNHQTVTKCPCCSLPIHIGDFRLVTLESVVPPRVHSDIRLVKLHRTKKCPAPYIPQRDGCKHSSPHTAPVVSDRDACFCRFNFVDTAMYQSQLSHNQMELTAELMALRRHVGKMSSTHQMEIMVLQMALENIRLEQASAMAELNEEEDIAQRYSGSSTGMYQTLPEHLFASDLSTAGEVSVGGDAPPIVTTNHGETTNRSCSLDCTSLSAKPGARQKSSTRREHCPPNVQSTMYLEEDGTQFYQSADGQLCYLSKFNMTCLLSDFSVHNPESLSGTNSVTFSRQQKLQPLPDEVQGTILAVERVHLTPELRKRIPFLSHVPVYTEVAFVELDLNSMLSDSTRHTFRAEFEKRRKKRRNMVAMEKKTDRLASKQDELRIEELKSRVQHIDVSNDFFLDPPRESLTGDGFGPSLVPSANEPDGKSAVVPESPFAPSSTTLSFSAAARGGFSILNPGDVAENEAFPFLISSRYSEDTEVTKKPATVSSSFSGTASTSKRKKSKGKKIVLFSTGGHRGAGL